MVGIILASHGGFAEGIYQSGEMIFGKQENVKACILKPSEGPDDIRKKMEDAIASFDDPEQVLFLICKTYSVIKCLSIKICQRSFGLSLDTFRISS